MKWRFIDFPLLQYDRLKIESIFSNLLPNAIKYSDTGIISIDVSTDAQTHYMISVSDQSRDISTEDLELIFDRFSQMDSAGTRRGGGSGIGLVLKKQLVELINGAIMVKSSPNKGATFEVRLPLHVDVTARTLKPSPPL